MFKKDGYCSFFFKKSNNFLECNSPIFLIYILKSVLGGYSVLTHSGSGHIKNRKILWEFLLYKDGKILPNLKSVIFILKFRSNK